MGTTIATPVTSLPSPLLTAGDVIMSVRQQIPDTSLNVDAAGNPLPDADGTFASANTLYRWLNDGLRVLVRLTGWAIRDWFAMPARAKQATYRLDPLWSAVEAAWAYQYPLSVLPEDVTLFPAAQGPVTSQPLWYGVHRRAQALEVFFWPVPHLTDPSTTLSTAIGAADDPIAVVSTSGWPSYGWVQIENELIAYQQVTATSLGVLTRGASFTAATSHPAGVTVQVCGLWLAGSRAPLPATSSVSVLEVPQTFIPALEKYILSRVRQAEQEFGEARALQQEFTAMVHEIRADPTWRQPTDAQTPAYASPRLGPIYFGRLIVR
jgi:hypothetical protein